MIDTINIELDGCQFSIQQFNALEAMKLETKTIKLIAPILSLFTNIKSLDQDLKSINLSETITGILNNIDEQTLETYILTMLKNTFIHINTEGIGTRPTPITKQVFSDFFVGRLLTVYKLLYEVMRVNKFAFFDLWGGLQNKTIGEIKQQQKMN